jgi:two-component system LytT family sensor kinase
MKRISLHLLFWVAYVIQDALLEYLWLGPALKNIPENIQLLKAFEAAIVILIPKLLFTYYVIYFAIDRILAEKNKLFLIAAEILFFLLVTILLYRILFNYYVYPKIYAGIIKTRPVFDGRLILLALMDIGFVSGAAISFKLLRKQLTGKEREKGLIKEKLEAELKFLRTQTNPHFLFNTLNNIYGLARVKSDHTPDAVMKLSKLLRFMIYESKKEFIHIGDEIKMLEDYIELEKIRYNDRLNISFNKEIDDLTQPVTPLLLLPLVENAFKHGAGESRFNSFIHIYMQLADGKFNFEIENSKENGIIDEATDNIGLGNLKRQLELLYKEHRLDINNGQNIFRVILNINLDKHAKV